MTRTLFIILTVLLCHLTAPTAFAFPFNVGERLEYDLSWAGIKAGITIFEVVEIKDVRGREAYHLSSQSRTTGFVSKFYEIDEKANAYLDKKNLYSLGIRIDERRKDQVRKKEVLFDQDAHRAVYTKNGEISNHEIGAAIQDSLSSFYYLRTRDLSPGDELKISTFENGTSYEITAKALQREKISVPAGTFDAIKIHLLIRYKEEFKEKGETLIWLSDDDFKIPVIIKTQTNAGYITAKLTKMKKGEINGTR